MLAMNTNSLIPAIDYSGRFDKFSIWKQSDQSKNTTGTTSVLSASYLLFSERNFSKKLPLDIFHK